MDPKNKYILFHTQPMMSSWAVSCLAFTYRKSLKSFIYKFRRNALYTIWVLHLPNYTA